MANIITYKDAVAFDTEDTLNKYKEEFYKPKDKIYFDGNSLGLLSKRSEETLSKILQSWKEYGIDGWTEGEHPWFYMAEELGELMSTLLGAKPTEVIVTGSTTVNLHQILATFFQPCRNKMKILTDELAFPTDIYAIQSHLKLHNLDANEHLEKVKSKDGYELQEQDIINAMTEDIALIILPSVLYRSGQLLDIEKLTNEAHKRDILIGFDLCHSIGAIPHQLSDWGVDLAFWCNYKHLNGGPGAVGGLFVHERHFGSIPGLSGWFSSNKEKQFDMEHALTPAFHAGSFQMGTPHILSMAPLFGSLSLFNEVKIEEVRQKSLKLTRFFMDLMEQELRGHQFTLRTPIDNNRRGGHLLYEHAEAASICKALKDRGVIPDFRSPNAIRFAPVSLYNTFDEVWNAVQILKEIMETKQYKKFDNSRGVIA